MLCYAELCGMENDYLQALAQVVLPTVDATLRLPPRNTRKTCSSILSYNE